MKSFRVYTEDSNGKTREFDVFFENSKALLFYLDKMFEKCDIVKARFTEV